MLSSWPSVFLFGLWVTANYLLSSVSSQRFLVPSNVTVRELSASTALVTWLLDDETRSDGANDNGSTDMSSYPFRQEITYRMHHERQRMIIGVPSDVTSYILSDLRPGGVYTVKISSVIKGRRLKSNPVRFIMSRYSSAGLAALEESLYRTTTWTLTTSASSSSAASASSMETSSLPAVLLPPLSPSHPSGQVHRNNRLTGTNFSSVGGGDYRFPPTNYSAGVVYVRGEEVGIVVLVLIVWVAAVALFFHRWGKIRMLLPYQPVFKEEEPAIVGCSPSPTVLQMSGQQSQLLPSSSLSQSQPPVPPSAVHVSANKFVSLDPAAVRRNQFMLHSRLARMQAYSERRNWPASMSGLDHCIIVGRSPLPAARQKAYAGRRANTIAAEACDCCERPIHSCRRQNDPGHQPGGRHHHHRHPRFASNGCSCDEEQPRKAHSAEVITFTVTSCDTPTNNSGMTSNSTPDLPDAPPSPPPTSPPPPPSKPERPIDFSPRLEARMAECSL